VDLTGVVVVYKSPVRCGAMEALLRGLDRVLTVGRSVQTASGYDFSAASALRDPAPLEAGYFGAPESYDLNTVTEIKRTDTIPVCRGVRAVQMRKGFRLDQSRLSVASTTLGSLSQLVFPFQHFTHRHSGEQLDQMKVSYTGGDPVCVLRVGYVENQSPDSPGIAYVCSFQLHGELERQFNSIRCMAYNLCWSFQRNAETRQPSTPADVLARMRSLCGYLLATWGPDECMYSLDAEDVRLLRCLRGTFSIGGGNFNPIFKDGDRLPDFLASKRKTLVTQMKTVVAAFEQRFITTWDDPTITLQISPGKCYFMTYDVSVDKPYRRGMRPWVLYDVKSGTGVDTFDSIERMVSFVCARVKRLELCCLFQDKIRPHRPQKRFHL
jgi:hypothetical protein